MLRLNGDERERWSCGTAPLSVPGRIALLLDAADNATTARVPEAPVRSESLAL
jgi:hypothetical protein